MIQGLIFTRRFTIHTKNIDFARMRCARRACSCLPWADKMASAFEDICEFLLHGRYPGDLKKELRSNFRRKARYRHQSLSLE